MTESPKVSVIIPAYNEEQSLVELHRRVDATFKEEETSYELIFVDDCSTDGTLSVIRGLEAEHDNVVVLSHNKNHGKSMALMQGMDAARGEIFVTMDADLQEEPEEIPLLLARLGEGYDIVGGCRAHRKDGVLKGAVSALYNLLVSLLLRHVFKDINCGFKAFTREVAQRFNLRGDMHRLMPAIAMLHGYRFSEVEISHHPRPYGKSKYFLLRYRGLFDLIAFTVLNTTQLRPFHVMAEIGFVLVVIAGLFLTIPVLTFSLADEPGGLLRFFAYTSGLLGGLLAFVGVQCPLAGLVLESVSSLSQDKDWRTRLLRRSGWK
ncbi:glycosyltransferase [Pseudodesulfovibrio cashew]|uniref:Glycosyltransferase n=1 Tax=Pseudodesulfovibrio cashew TaxID=2678688 RepID=A0A6I6JEC1_9BACT|nr:glycosyltransferase family 2 protein [Pseudodesulfovibrio cashew]QGY39358.1 glycosyltransferase [Pseudodesulfovibrio cashew]